MAKLSNNKILERGKYLSLFAIIFLLIISTSTAEYLESYKGDLEYKELLNGKGQTWQLNFTPMNDINQIISSIVYFDFSYVPTTHITFLITMQVNKQFCKPESWKLGGDNGESITPYSSKTIKFDCSNIINRKGIYDIIVTSEQPIKGVSGSYEINYYSHPVWQKSIENIEEVTKKPVMQVFGTEYIIGDNATAFLQLQSGGQPVNNAECFLRIYYPNKSVFVNNTPMTYIGNSAGIYYYDFTIPSIYGVYIYDASCWYQVGGTLDKVATNYNLLIGDLTGGTYSDTNFYDSVFHRHKEIGTPARLDLIYNFSTINLPFLGGVITLNVTTSYRWNDNLENLDLYLFNYNNSTWVKLDTSLDYSTSTKTVMNYITFENNPENYISSSTNGNMALRITDSVPSDSSIKEFYFDYLNIKISY